MTRTIRQSLKGRIHLSDGLLIIGALIAGGSILLWDWRSHIAFVLAGLLAMVVGATLRLRVRCPQCTYMLGRPVNFCPNCGVNLDNPRH
jgi:CHASE2 domain-containing sensor protein